jgi:hypothetical protein
MDKRGTGTILLAISAFLFATRVLGAALVVNNLFDDNGNSNFSEYLDVIGGPLLVWSIIALCTGIIYIILAEIQEVKIKSNTNTTTD